MSSKVKVTLEPGESYVVADNATWTGLVDTMVELAYQYEEGTPEHINWMEIAAYFQQNAERNMYMGEYEDEGWN